VKHMVHWCQFCITPVYAFTEYQAQGPMIPYSIANIGKPPSGKLNLCNSYVSLARQSG
ncbi:hypothetical protein NEOLEDRAFT_1030241, partial [Neolentinus lepideus HHB14362 ss-1]